MFLYWGEGGGNLRQILQVPDNKCSPNFQSTNNLAMEEGATEKLPNFLEIIRFLLSEVDWNDVCWQ